MYKREEIAEKNFSIAILIKIIDEAIEKKANRILRQYNLTVSQARILVCLSSEEEKGHSLKELEKLFHVAQQTVAGTVSRLESKGLVTAFSERDDKRIKKVRLTEDGRKVIECVDREISELEVWLETGFDGDEKKNMRCLLQKLYHKVEQST